MLLSVKYLNICIKMYSVQLIIYNRETNNHVISLNIGIFNRISTAERIRKGIQECNPNLIITSIYEKFDP